MYICLFTVASPVNKPANSGNFFATTAYRPVHIFFLYNQNSRCLASQKHKFTDRNPKVVFSVSEDLRINDLVLVYMYE